MRRFLLIAVGMVLATVAGVASASMVSLGSAAEQPPDQRDAQPAGSVTTGSTVADTHGGPPWAVRIFDGDTAYRCILAARTDGKAFGPVDADGRIQDIGAIPSGSCGDPSAEPLQTAVIRYADSDGTGARSVLFGVADASVKSITVVSTGFDGDVTPDASGTFAVVTDGLAPQGSWTIAATLADGTVHTYRL